MKLYILTEKGCEYNDYTYDLQEGGLPVAAYRSKENADNACLKKNAEKAISGDFPLDGHQKGEPYFVVTEVEVEDNNLISYSDKLQAAQKAREEAKKLAKGHLDSLLEKLFQDHPKLQAFKWTQYTPYFNDGEECVFSVNVYPEIQYEGWNDGEMSDFSNYNNEEPEEVDKAYKDVESLIESVDASDMKEVFGDHVEVTASRSGFDVDEYCHD